MKIALYDVEVMSVAAMEDEHGVEVADLLVHQLEDARFALWTATMELRDACQQAQTLDTEEKNRTALAERE